MNFALRKPPRASDYFGSKVQAGKKMKIIQEKFVKMITRNSHQKKIIKFLTSMNALFYFNYILPTLCLMQETHDLSEGEREF